MAALFCDDCVYISSQYLISDNLRSNQPTKMDVDSDSEMPTAGPSMGKVKHNSDHDNCFCYLISANHFPRLLNQSANLFLS